MDHLGRKVSLRLCPQENHHPSGIHSIMLPHWDVVFVYCSVLQRESGVTYVRLVAFTLVTPGLCGLLHAHAVLEHIAERLTHRRLLLCA